MKKNDVQCIIGVIILMGLGGAELFAAGINRKKGTFENFSIVTE